MATRRAFDTAPIGPHTFIEVLAPTTAEHSIARWLGRVGGSSGWVLSTQVPSLDGVKERAAERGVRIAVQTQAMGKDIIQLYPLDAGVLLELDAFLLRDEWFWDSTPAAQASRSTKVDDIDPPVATADGAAISFGRRIIRFVPAKAARTGMVAVDMHATDRAIAGTAVSCVTR